MGKIRFILFFISLNCLVTLFIENDLSAQGTIALDQSSKKISKRKAKVNLSKLENYGQNYKKAIDYYHKGLWLSAAKIFEEIYPLAIGTPRADTILFLFASSYYNNKDFEIAAFHFKDYARRYVGSVKAEEASFLSAKSLYLVSPPYYLDQSETLAAQDEIKIFISMYPKSKFIEDCNTMMDDIRGKLAQKNFEAAKLYYHRELYRATQIAVKNFMKQYAESIFVPEALSMLIKNNYNYAKQSVTAKQIERYYASIEAYDQLKSLYPESKYIAECEKVVTAAKKQIEKLMSNKL